MTARDRISREEGRGSVKCNVTQDLILIEIFKASEKENWNFFQDKFRWMREKNKFQHCLPAELKVLYDHDLPKETYCPPI